MRRNSIIYSDPREKLLEKAANTTNEGISISDMRLPDQPLIYLNKGFETLTGYSREEVLGLNCRFLQGKDTTSSEVDKIREAIKMGKACTVELLNYKKDGTPFWNRLSITPLHNQDHVVTHYVGVQSDITELKRTKNQLQKTNEELRASQELIDKELSQAKIAQEFLLPALPDSMQYRMASKFVPMAQIGGDFFDIIQIDSSTIGILIADVTGHGIPAALLTFMSSTAFKNVAIGNKSAKSVVTQTNQRLYTKMPDDSFVTLFYAIYDSAQQTLKYTQAGHSPALLLKSGSKDIIPLETKDPLVGAFSSAVVQFRERKTQLSSGDRIILYTDAIIEAKNRAGEQLGVEGLSKFMMANWNTPLEQLLDKLYDFGLAFSERNFYDDDFTMLGFEIF